ERTTAEVRAAVREVLQGGAQGLLLDLRNNPGGLLTASIEVADLFLEDGPIVHVVNRDQRRFTYRAEGPGTFPRVPMVVLVNQFSASAREIVSGALRARALSYPVGTTN